jgi:hypothetical protein
MRNTEDYHFDPSTISEHLRLAVNSKSLGALDWFGNQADTLDFM